MTNDRLSGRGTQTCRRSPATDEPLVEEIEDMRHRRRGRKLGRNPNHQRALLRNLAAALILTERDAEDDDNKPKVKGRIVTTLCKAKEVRPLVEKCVTIACRALVDQENAEALKTTAARHSEQWRAWRASSQRTPRADRRAAAAPSRASCGRSRARPAG